MYFLLSIQRINQLAMLISEWPNVTWLYMVLDREGVWEGRGAGGSGKDSGMI